VSRKTKKQICEVLDAETLAALDEGLKLAENGRRWTMEQAFDIVRKRRKEWKTIRTDQLSA
jgi:predicted transcriptional regulator